MSEASGWRFGFRRELKEFFSPPHPASPRRELRELMHTCGGERRFSSRRLEAGLPLSASNNLLPAILFGERAGVRGRSDYFFASSSGLPAFLTSSLGFSSFFGSGSFGVLGTAMNLAFSGSIFGSSP